jgi:hypothetical protein
MYLWVIIISDYVLHTAIVERRLKWRRKRSAGQRWGTALFLKKENLQKYIKTVFQGLVPKDDGHQDFTPVILPRAYHYLF